jgi:nicotinate-nucleotide adenylyltransferase
VKRASDGARVGATLGVLGGSFDPPHVAHVMLALLGLSLGGLSRVLVVPTFIHAFQKQLSPFPARVHMCELAFAPLKNVEVSTIEAELGGVSRTLRLVKELAKRHPHEDLRLLIGSDILAERARWQDFDEIVAIAPLMVAARAGYASHDAQLGAALPQVSSTELRAQLAGGAASEFVPANVHAYALAQGLYRGQEPA